MAADAWESLDAALKRAQEARAEAEAATAKVDAAEAVAAYKN